MKRKNSEIHFLTKDDLKRLLDKAKSDNYRNYVMLLLGYRHGLRASEIVNITVDSVDTEAGNIHCRRGKGSISNWQSLPKDEIEAIKQWMRKRPKTTSRHLFVSSTGKPIGRVQLYKIFKKYSEAIELPSEKSHPHILKHSLGSHLANSGVPVQVIMARLGHKNISNTMIYLQIASSYTDRAFESALANGAVV